MLAFNKDFHNKIAKTSYDHFYKHLPKTGKPNSKEWTVLSVIIKINKRKNEDWQVVALGTGSKCIGSSKMSNAGDILNDSHAEVVCRRAFLRYLYGQMEQCLKHFNLKKSMQGDLSGGNLEKGNFPVKLKSIFELNEEKEKFFLDNKVTFHFFTTYVPCGDASIFPKKESEEIEEHGDAITNATDNILGGDEARKTLLKRTQEEDGEVQSKRFKEDERVKEEIEIVKDQIEKDVDTDKGSGDIYRTGAKCLPEEVNQDLKREGNAYHTLGLVRTKPGRGDPTLSVSCSDKLARWCHLGLQGALVSLLVDDFIFMSSLTVAGDTHFCLEALERALYKRLQPTCMKKLEVPIRIEIGQSDLGFDAQKNSERQPCPSSIVWWKSSEKNFLEVAVEGKKQGVTKKHLNTFSGRLNICKKELFSCFTNLVQEMKKLEVCLQVSELIPSTSVSYKEAKACANSYQDKWKVLKEEGFKLWTTKDPKQTEFLNDPKVS